jgi:hypothetical protein
LGYRGWLVVKLSLKHNSTTSPQKQIEVGEFKFKIEIGIAGGIKIEVKVWWEFRIQTLNILLSEN